MIGRIACLVGLELVLAVSAHAALTDSSTPALPPTTPLQEAPKPPKVAPSFTFEQEAALVEVRKILREARQLTEDIELPNRLLTDRHKLKAMEQIKSHLLEDIGTAQFRAGDFEHPIVPTQRVYFVRALANYGRLQESIQAASQENLIDDGLVILADLLIKAGDVKAALQLVEASSAKEQLQWWRDRKRAVAFALIALRQYEQGDPGAKATLERALKAAQAIKVPEDRYRAFIHVARTQASAGDKAASVESFREAKQAALVAREDGPAAALMWTAKAQGETGDKAGSEQTFQQVFELAQGKSDLNERAHFMGCLAWAQAISEHRDLATETLRRALDSAKSLSPNEKEQVLREIGQWQVKAGERGAVVETIEQIRTNGFDATTLAAQSGHWKKAMELVTSIPDDEWLKAGAIQFITSALIKTRDPFGTPEVFQQLSQAATRLQENHLPEDDRKKRNVLSSIAVVQAAAGEIPKALQTASRIDSLDMRVRATHGDIVSLLMEKGDVAGATQVIQSIKEEWFPLWGSVGVLEDFARAYAIRSEDTLVFMWMRKQAYPWAKTHALLGVAQGLMDRHHIPAIEGLKPAVPVVERCP